MNTSSVTLLCPVLVLILAFSAFARDLRVMTYNIRYDNPADAENRWDLRKEFLRDQIRFHEPHVLGIQEGLLNQVRFLKETMPGYEYVGVGRADGKGSGEFSAVFYDSSVLRVVESGTFWLSDTPEKVSVGWDAALERICTYAQFEFSGSRDRFWVFNTHFDHIGASARENSAKLILQRAEELNRNGLPMIIMGDLNAEPGSPPIRLLSERMTDAADSGPAVAFGPSGTFSGFRFDLPVTRRIDYVFLSRGHFKVRKYAVLSDSKDLRYPSDHLPVLVHAEIE